MAASGSPLLDMLPDHIRQGVRETIQRLVGSNGGIASDQVIHQIRESLRQQWSIEAPNHDVIATVLSLGFTRPPDPETQIGNLFSLLHAHCGPDGDVTAPPQLDVQICHCLQAVLSMGHNRALARRAHAEARANASGPPNLIETIGAQKAQSTFELVYSVIVDPNVDSSSYETQQPMGAAGRAALLRALDKVGVYARDDPFPDVATSPCALVSGCNIYTADGQRVPAMNGGYTFDVLRPSGAVGPYTGSGRCYAQVQLLKKAIYGHVMLAHVVTTVRLENGDTRLIWTEEKVAIKCISKQKVRNMQQNGSPMNENPLKEVRCLSYLTRRMSGALPGPEVIRGDPRYVLPMVDCLEDREYIYLVMPCLEEEMFNVVEARGGAFPEVEAKRYLLQILDGLEVAHSLGLAHHDMSLENLMTDINGAAVIIDWGMVVKVPLTDRGVPVKIASKNAWPCRCGKLLYLAPELLTAGETSPAFDPFKLDIWSCGVMLFVLLTGVPPWDVQTGPTPRDKRFQHVIKGHLDKLLQAWRIQLSPAAVQLLQALLVEDPSARPTIPQIRTFPWFAQ